jgi:hypothetical protein
LTLDSILPSAADNPGGGFETGTFMFHGDPVTVFTDTRGNWAVLGQLCGNLGLDANGQRQLVERKSWSGGRTCVTHVQLPGDSQARPHFLVHERIVPMWLANITTSRIPDERKRQKVELAQVDFVSRDAAGNALASDFTFVGPIPPGETRANESLAEYTGTEASAEFQLGEVQFGTEDPGLAVARIVSSNWREDPTAGEAGAIVWTVEVENTGTEVIEARVDFTTYDANGQILEYDFSFVGPITPGARAVGEGLADLRGTVDSVSYKVSGVSFDELVRR